MNEKWPRWLRASLAEHFNTNINGNYLHIEGQQHKEEEPDDRFELRVDGPDSKELPGKQYLLLVYVNLLVRVKQDIDIYKIDTYKGRGLKAFTTNINVFKYGDDDVLLGCLERYAQVIVTDYYQVAQPNNILHATVESQYQITLSEGE